MQQIPWWTAFYSPEVPATLNLSRYESLIDYFDAHTQNDLPAYVFLGKKITYRELKKYANSFTHYLQAQTDLTKGCRMALVLPNVLAYPVALFGALQAGLTIVNVNPLYTAREMQHQLADSEASAVVVLENMAHVIESIMPNLPHLKHIIIARASDLLPLLKAKMVEYWLRYGKGEVTNYHIKNAVYLSSLLTLKNKPVTNVPLQKSDIAFLQYTGGTTGVAKGAILTHGNMLANAQQALAWFTPLRHHVQQHVAIAALPFYHIFSLTCHVLALMGLNVCNVLVPNPKQIKTLIDAWTAHDCTIFFGVSTLFNALVRNNNFRQLSFKNLQMVVAGGMAMQPSVAEAWQALTDMPIIQGYGLTEASPIVSVNRVTDDKFRPTIGLPVPETEIRIVDDNQQEVALGESGELWVRGPQVMQGYWRQTESPLTAEGWLPTGDIVMMSEEGHMTLLDRKKDIIVIAGYNVYPNEIEAVLAQHPGIDEVAVIGVPADKTGEKIKAFIVRNDASLTASEVMAYCHTQLIDYKVPKSITFLESLPKSSVGKILRRSLVSAVPLD